MLTLSAAALLLVSCGSTPSKQEVAPSEQALTLDTLQAYLSEMANYPKDEQVRRTLNASDFLVVKNELDRAHRLLDSISDKTIPQALRVQYAVVSAKLALAEGEPFIAQRYLFDENTEQYLDASPIDIAIELYDLRAQLMFNRAEYIRSFEERLKLTALLSANDDVTLQLNHDLIWESLSELPTATLFKNAKTDPQVIRQGWYSLAALSKTNGANFRRQIVDIEKWQQIWPDHPANQLLPADLQLILQLADQQALNIAVLLPLSGKLAAAGQAIREGVLAAYYDDVSHTTLSPQISFIDTHNADINAVYDQLHARGIELIIGPLSKSNVVALAQRETLQIPTLALNTISASDAIRGDSEIDSAQPQLASPIAPRTTHQNLFQFGLDVESETAQVAERAWRDGHRRALIIAPLSSWGDRGVEAFKQAWHAAGGELLDDKRYRDQRSYSALVESSVAVDKSKQRKRELQRLLGTNLEFEPRRRKDVDFIFLLAHPAQGKQLKPLLAYHYAGDIPIYATSHIFNDPNTSNLSDLNGVRFSSMPWHFDGELNERRAIQAYGENFTPYQALYAFGVDAYHIYPRLEQLQLIRQAQFYGSTGKLRVESGNTIARIQTWAEIKKGNAVELKIDVDLDSQIERTETTN